MRSNTSDARPALLGAAILGLAILSGAFYFEKVLGLRPCEMCLVERRFWYAGIAAAILLALPLPFQRDLRRLGAAALCLSFATGAAYALYHVAVEQHWVAGPSACTGNPLTGLDPAAALATLSATPTVRCDEVQWSLFGISLAGFDAMALTVAAALAASAVRPRQAVRRRFSRRSAI